MAIALPLLYVLSPLLPGRKVFLILMHVLVMVVGALFIVDFKLRKPTVMEMILLVGVVALAVVILIFIGRSWWVFIHHTKFPMTVFN